jgi:hypothetical protein
MKTVFAGMLIVGLIAPALHAAELPQQTSQELCTVYAMSLMTGEQRSAWSQSEIEAELRSRGELCKPASLYMDFARERIANIRANAEMSARVQADNERFAATQQVMEEQAAAERRAWRKRALLDLGTQMLQTPQSAPSPRTTTCQPNGIGGVTCNTW